MHPDYCLYAVFVRVRDDVDTISGERWDRVWAGQACGHDDALRSASIRDNAHVLTVCSNGGSTTVREHRVTLVTDAIA
jgi:hypothetical protein